ncbi:MAG: diadenosine tetraphosphatase ApaH/serine/threonine PP2A family protein phosphatase, partial [Verrucomicrobiales bacterium]
EVLSAIRSQTDHFVLGNHDAAAVGIIDVEWFNPSARAVIEWTREQLSAESKQFLLDTPLTLETEDILFVHAEITEPGRFNYIENADDATSNLASNDHFVTFVGHTHQPLVFDLDTDGEVRPLPDENCQLEENHRYVINVGSVGEPRNPDDIRARYVIYDSDTREVFFRRIDFDAEAYRLDLAGTTLEVTPYFLNVLDHKAATEDGAIQAMTIDMEAPENLDYLKRFQVRQPKRLVLPDDASTATKPKPRPVSDPRKLSLTAVITIFIAVVLLAGIGVLFLFQPGKKSGQPDSGTAATNQQLLAEAPKPAQAPIEPVTVAKLETPNPKPPPIAEPKTPAPKPIPKSKPNPPPVPKPEPKPETLAYWRFGNETADAVLADSGGVHPLKMLSPGRVIGNLAPDPIRLTDEANTSALTLGVWAEPEASGVFDLTADASFTFEGWLMNGGEQKPVTIAESGNWRVDVRAGADSESPGSMRFRLSGEGEPIDVMTTEIELYSPAPHHFAVVWNHADAGPEMGAPQLFYDGENVANGPIPHSRIGAPETKPFQLGSTSNPQRVALDEVRFSRVALSSARFLAGIPHNVSSREMSGMQLLYQRNGFNTFGDANKYDVDNSADIKKGSFDRVGYYLELDDFWVWVSMDAFKTDPALVGVPAVGSNIVENGTEVSNMTIESNHPNVKTGSGIAGIVEFWSSNYNGRVAGSTIRPTSGIGKTAAARRLPDMDRCRWETSPLVPKRWCCRSPAAELGSAHRKRVTRIGRLARMITKCETWKSGSADNADDRLREQTRERSRSRR